jgi:adenylate cyclase
LKNKLWLIPIPIILLFTLFQITFDWGEQGKLQSSFLRNEIFQFSKNTNGILTNIKFKLRGETKPDPRIVILAADDIAVEKLGRWPWHRLDYARLFNYTLNTFNAKMLGIDVVYSEAERAITPEIEDIIAEKNPKLLEELKNENGDAKFAMLFEHNRDNIVLGYAPAICQPAYLKKEECPVEDIDINKSITEKLEKFSIKSVSNFSLSQLSHSSFPQIISGLFNIDEFNKVSKNAGYFSADPDPDGFIRNYSLIYSHHNKSYPSLGLKMAELALNDEVITEFDEDTRLKKIYFSKNPNTPIPSTRLGFIGINFRGKSGVYPYISAYDVIRAAEDPDASEEFKEKIASQLKDKFVLFGVTALGLYDMRAFPFDSNTPGVEGHANALDNLLNNDLLKSASSIGMPWLPLALLILVGFTFSFLFARLEAVPSLIVFATFLIGFGYIDIHFLFGRNINLPTAFIYLESFLIFALTLSIRYVLEEQGKKQIKATFSHYLAPAVVDMVLKDPSKLVVGGERREITILFTDVAGFTSISEGLDPKTLSLFLNEYLGAMTDVIFESKGTLDKYIGDAIMSFWGAPLDQPNHAYLACTTALKMQQRLKEIAPDIKKRYNIDVNAGIGLNAGTVSVGNMGSDKIFAYTALGDSVNLAARLEGLTRMYKTWVLTTKDTIDKVNVTNPGGIYYRVLDSVKVKGKKVATDIVAISLTPFDAKADELFQKARGSFLTRDWDGIKAMFAESSKLYEAHIGQPDPVAKIFMERCEYYKSHPPEENWDGSIEMKEK